MIGSSRTQARLSVRISQNFFPKTFLGKFGSLRLLHTPDCLRIYLEPTTNRRLVTRELADSHSWPAAEVPLCEMLLVSPGRLRQILTRGAVSPEQWPPSFPIPPFREEPQVDGVGQRFIAGVGWMAMVSAVERRKDLRRGIGIAQYRVEIDYPVVLTPQADPRIDRLALDFPAGEKTGIGVPGRRNPSTGFKVQP